MSISLFSRNYIPKPKTCRITLKGWLESPGHSAQYCIYTAMDNVPKKIIYVVTLDKRETERKSIRLKKEGFGGAEGQRCQHCGGGDRRSYGDRCCHG